MMITLNATKEDKLIILDSNNLALFELFVKSISEGSRLTVTYELVTDDKSYAQLSKVHKCIRDLASHTGHTFDEVKKMIKADAGLIDAGGDYRSFATCSKEELSQAIQAAITIGQKIGFLLY